MAMGSLSHHHLVRMQTPTKSRLRILRGDSMAIKFLYRWKWSAAWLSVLGVSELIIGVFGR